MSRLSLCTSIDIKKLLYISFANSIISYCITVWGSTSNTALQPLIKLQKMIIKKIYNFQFSSSLAFKLLNLLDIHQMYKYNSVVFVYKTIKGISPESISNIIKNVQINTNNYSTRYKANLRKPQFTIKVATNSIAWKGTEIFNSLPESLKAEHSLKTFKKNSKDYFLNK